MLDVGHLVGQDAFQLAVGQHLTKTGSDTHRTMVGIAARGKGIGRLGRREIHTRHG